MLQTVVFLLYEDIRFLQQILHRCVFCLLLLGVAGSTSTALLLVAVARERRTVFVWFSEWKREYFSSSLM